MANDTSTAPKTATARKRIGEVLVEAGLVNVEQVVMALAYQRVHGGRLGAALVALGMLDADQLHSGLARQLGIATADLETFAPPDEMLSLLPEPSCGLGRSSPSPCTTGRSCSAWSTRRTRRR